VSKRRNLHKTEIVDDVLITNAIDPVELTPGFIASPKRGIERYHNDELHVKLMAIHKQAFSANNDVRRSYVVLFTN
jgi:hypothetical protein